MASRRSVASRESDGGLSWAGSFVGPIDDEDFLGGERQDRMSSAMVPGGGKFEKGKWVSACTRQRGADPTKKKSDPCFMPRRFAPVNLKNFVGANYRL